MQDTVTGRFIKCKVHDPLDRTKSGYCRQCALLRSSEWRKKNRNYIRSKYPERNRKQNLKKYNITVEDFNEMLIAQNNNCKLCLQPSNYTLNDKKRNLDIDHCHKTGKIRGLLCTSCNRALGLFKDDIEVLKRAIEYLK